MLRKNHPLLLNHFFILNDCVNLRKNILNVLLLISKNCVNFALRNQINNWIIFYIISFFRIFLYIFAKYLFL